MVCEDATALRRLTRANLGFHSSSSTFLALERLDIFQGGAPSSGVPALRFPRNFAKVTLADVDGTESVTSTLPSLLESGTGKIAGESEEQTMMGEGLGDALGDCEKKLRVLSGDNEGDTEYPGNGVSRG